MVVGGGEGEAAGIGVEEELDGLLHGGAEGGVLVGAADGEAQGLDHVVLEGPRNALVQNLHGSFPGVHLVGHPVYDVLVVSELGLHRLLPRYQLHQHHPEAVHVALRRRLRRERVLCMHARAQQGLWN